MGIGYLGYQFKLGAPSVLFIRIERVGDAVVRITKKKKKETRQVTDYILYTEYWILVSVIASSRHTSTYK